MARPVRVRQGLHATPLVDLSALAASNARRPSRWLVVALLLGLAALVRVSAMFYQFISGDDARVALMAQHILTGENFPAFFYGQTYMGSLNGFHLVPALFAFGPSVLLVRLNAIAWSLLFPLGLYVLSRRIFDESTARVALLLSALPPFLLTYQSTVAEPHFETNTFGVVLMLLALSALSATTEPRRTRALGCLGFVAGLACWTNLKAVVVLGPILLVLLIRDPRLPLRRGGLLLGAGFLVGSLPAWLFYATHPDRGVGRHDSVRQLFGVAEPSWADLWRLLVEIPAYLVGAYRWAPATSVRLAALVACESVYVVALVLASIEAVRAVRGRAGVPRAWGLWLLLLALVANLAALYGSSLFRIGGSTHTRYVLPAYIPLLVVVAWAIARLGRRSRLMAGAVLTFLLTFNLWTNLAYLWPLQPAERTRRATLIATREALAGHLRSLADHDGGSTVLVANPHQSLVWQFLLPQLSISALSSEIYYPSSVRADAAARVAILDDHGEVPVALQLRVLGVGATERRFGGWRLYEDLGIPARAYRLLPRTRWRAVGEPGGLPAVTDGDLSTAWPGRPLDTPEKGELVLDFGAPQPVARLVWWPTAALRQIAPLEIAGSLDGTVWERMGVAPAQPGHPAFFAAGRPVFRPRNGWIELTVQPRSVRFLRIRPAEPGPVGIGAVGELFAYELLAQPADDRPFRLDVDALVAAVRARGVTRLLADPVVSARVARATGGEVATLPANATLNNHGFIPRLDLFSRVRVRATDAALVPAEDAGELAERFVAADLRVAGGPIGDYVLFQPIGLPGILSRCRRVAWRVTAEIPQADGDHTRYLVEANLGRVVSVTGLRLAHPEIPDRDASIAGLDVSDDGHTWRAVDGVSRVLEWAWAGRTLFRFSGGPTELTVDGADGQILRVAIDLPSRGGGTISSFCVRTRP